MQTKVDSGECHRTGGGRAGGHQRGQGSGGGLGESDILDPEAMEVVEDNKPTLPIPVGLTQLEEGHAYLAHQPMIAREERRSQMACG